MTVMSVLEVVQNKRWEMDQAHQGVFDDTCGEWMTLKVHRGAPQLKHLEPNACAFGDLSHERDTRKNVRLCHALRIRRGVLSSRPVACTTFSTVCTRNL